MAKKQTKNDVAMPMIDDKYRVQDAVNSLIRHQEIVDDKPLFRQAKRSIRRLARSVSRGGRR